MMSFSLERMQLLRDRIRFFEGLSFSELRQILQKARRKHLHDGQLILRQGAPATRMYVIISGQVRVTRNDGEGEEDIAVLPPGTTVGEMAFVDASPRSAQAVARGETLVLEFGRELMFGVSSAVIRKLFRNLAAIIAGRLRTTTELVNARGDELVPALAGKNLTGTDLSGCILAGVPAREADLRGADLRGADMRGADLRGVDLRGARMEGAVLDDATAEMTPSDERMEAITEEMEIAPPADEGPQRLPDRADDALNTADSTPDRDRRIRSAWGSQRPQERPASRAVARPPTPESDGARFITSARRTLRTQGMNKPLSEAIAEGPEAVSDYWKRLMKKAGEETPAPDEKIAAVAENSRQRQW